MKIKLILIHFLFLLAIPAYPQSSWYQQTTPPDINILLSINFTDTNHGVSCGWYNYNGRAIYTSNGGNNWLSAQIPDSSRSLVTVQFVNSQTGYIAGAYNISSPFKFVISKNAQRRINFTNSLIRKSYKQIGIDTGAVYKGLFLKTIDGGMSWSTYGTLPDSIYYLIGLYFLNSSTGYLTVDRNIYSGQAAILKTTNGGLIWNALDIPPGISTLWGIYFLNANTGFAYGYRQTTDTTFLSVLLKTTDGGSMWNELNFTDLQNLTSMDFSDTENGILTGSTIEPLGQPLSKAYKTTNGGLNWLLADLQINYAVFRGVKLVKSTGTGIIFSDISDSIINISKTTDFGTSWTTIAISNTTAILNSASLVDQNNWYLCGGNFTSNGVILHTSNGGNPIGITPVSNEVPESYSLSQNYPNPFNPVTKIRFNTPPQPSPKERGTVSVRLVVYDILGREVAILVNEQLKPGSYEVEWPARTSGDGSNYPNGVYFYKLTAGDFIDVKKMVLLK